MFNFESSTCLSHLTSSMKNLLLIWFLLFAVAAGAQKNTDTYYLFDKEWNQAKDMKAATYFMHSISQHDTLFVCRVYKKDGPMVRQESYKDKELSIPHGQFIWYDEEGKIDSVGMVNNRKKDGQWHYYNDTFGVDQSSTYKVGKLLERRNYKTKKTFTPEKGEVDFAAEPKDSVKVTYTDEKEAVFKGGLKGLRKYLEKNLQVPERTANLGIGGNVNFQFLINKEGRVDDILIIKSLEWAADAAALKVMSQMPDWEPARQNGKNVIYQCIQKITFTASN